MGAWKDDQLAAFISIVEVEGWVEMPDNYSMDALRQYHPNEALLYSALTHYLTERHCRMVSYSLSSIQVKSNTASLHRFKLKVGFESKPVHRGFAFHLLLQPIANRATLGLALRGLNVALRFLPHEVR